MLYELVLNALDAGEGCSLVTVIRADSRRTGAVRFYSPARTAGGLGEEWLDREADRLAARSLAGGKVETARLSAPGKPEEQVILMAEPFFLPEELVVLGGGNIAQPLVRIAALLGFKVTVVDDRPSFASPGLFPDAWRVLCEPFENFGKVVEMGPWSSVVIITRGHKHDLVCLKQAVGRDLAYLGMIGSRRRVKLIREHLRELGVPESRLEEIFMPIGLDIGAQTPAEIAVSIAAELVKVRRNGKARSLAEEAGGGRPAGPRGAGYLSEKDVELLRVLVDCGRSGTPAVLATVAAAKGSTPRKAGAKMLIFRDGRTLGTIGGGCVEGEVIRKALDVFDSGAPVLFQYYLDSDVAAGEGMACGGAMEVFLAPVEREDGNRA
ncbi:MAG: XdhC family protein [Firmicutes bacterium]|nr:XdhC family protein [Bacillota bacterium]